MSLLVPTISSVLPADGLMRGGSGGHRGRPRHEPSMMRFGSWNDGTLTGKSIELVKLLHERRVGCACIQETKWVGNKARQIGRAHV